MLYTQALLESKIRPRFRPAGSSLSMVRIPCYNLKLTRVEKYRSRKIRLYKMLWRQKNQKEHCRGRQSFRGRHYKFFTNKLARFSLSVTCIPAQQLLARINCAPYRGYTRLVLPCKYQNRVKVCGNKHASLVQCGNNCSKKKVYSFGLHVIGFFRLQETLTTLQNKQYTWCCDQGPIS